MQTLFIGLGTNLPRTTENLDQESGPQLLTSALQELQARGMRIDGVSDFYRSEPVPVSDQDWFVNAVAQASTSLDPVRVLEIFHEVEAVFGRVRTVRNAARTLDLDLLDYGGVNRPSFGPSPHLPHPRLDQRAFVLLPLRDLTADWCHPVTGASLSDLIKNLPPGQRIEKLSP